MKSLPGLAAFRSSEIRERAGYEDVALEYYDEVLHPTCADFREASRVYLRGIFELESPKGRLADVGCGLSLVSEFVSDGLILVDESRAMLDLNDNQFEKRQIDITRASFGLSEFDWIFAVLGDPYNVQSAWANIAKALKLDGRCVFLSPSYRWAYQFRTASKQELSGKARFDLSSGESVFLPSNILSPDGQLRMVSDAGLTLERVDHVYVQDLARVRSSKISSVLKGDDAVLDIYRACRA